MLTNTQWCRVTICTRITKVLKYFIAYRLLVVSFPFVPLQFNLRNQVPIPILPRPLSVSYHSSSRCPKWNRNLRKEATSLICSARLERVPLRSSFCNWPKGNGQRPVISVLSLLDDHPTPGPINAKIAFVSKNKGLSPFLRFSSSSWSPPSSPPNSSSSRNNNRILYILSFKVKFSDLQRRLSCIAFSFHFLSVFFCSFSNDSSSLSL